MDAVILGLNVRTWAADGRAEAASARHRRRGCVLRLAEGYMAFVRANHRLWSILVEHRPGEERAFRTGTATPSPPRSRWSTRRPLFPDAGDRRRSVAVLWATLHGIASLSLGGKLGVVTPEDAPTLARLAVARYLAGRGA